MEIDRAAIDAETDRLFALFIRVRLLSRTRQIQFAEARAKAVRMGLVTKADWLVIRKV